MTNMTNSLIIYSIYKIITRQSVCMNIPVVLVDQMFPPSLLHHPPIPSLPVASSPDSLSPCCIIPRGMNKSRIITLIYQAGLHKSIS